MMQMVFNNLIYETKQTSNNNTYYGFRVERILDFLVSGKPIYNNDIVSGLIYRLSDYTNLQDEFIILYNRNEIYEQFNIDITIIESSIDDIKDLLLSLKRDSKNIFLTQILIDYFIHLEKYCAVKNLVDNSIVSGKIIKGTNTLNIYVRSYYGWI